MNALSLKSINVIRCWVSSCFFVNFDNKSSSVNKRNQFNWKHTWPCQASDPCWSSFIYSSSSLPIILQQAELCPELLGLLYFYFWETLFWSVFFFLLLKLTSSLHLLVNPLDLLWWSFDCWLWHRYIYPLEDVLHLANCCKEFFSSPVKEFFCHTKQLFF